MEKLTQQAIEFVDGTPDVYYAIRILKAYRENCDCRWATTTDGKCDNYLLSIMNKHCEERAVILDEAISILESNVKEN